MIYASIFGGTSVADVRKKFLISEFCMVFEFVTKVILLCSMKSTMTSIFDLFIIECLGIFELISLPTLMIKQMYMAI